MTTISPVAYTQINPYIANADMTGASDLQRLQQGSPESTFADDLIEYSARVCYHSTAKMGTAPNFIGKLIEKSHLDTIEHPTAVVLINDSALVQKIQRISNHVHVVDNIVSANLRVWRDLVLQGIAIDALPFLRTIAPKAFSEFAGDDQMDFIKTWDLNFNKFVCRSNNSIFNASCLAPVQAGQAQITLLGWAQPLSENAHVQEQCGAATFLIEGISRACSHQLVRHRLASFGQESQRYVDMDKGGWQPVIPPAIEADAHSKALMQGAWDNLSSAYRQLRAAGIRKEDARFLLPNAAETRMVVSMPFHAWSHFCWLRAVDKAAQWEIRAVGQSILQLLHTVAPEVFRAHVEALQ